MRPELRGALKLPEPEAPEGGSGGPLCPRYSEQQYLPHRHSTNICLREGEQKEERERSQV